VIQSHDSKAYTLLKNSSTQVASINEKYEVYTKKLSPLDVYMTSSIASSGTNMRCRWYTVVLGQSNVFLCFVSACGYVFSPFNTKQKMSFLYNNDLNSVIFHTYFFKLFESITLNFVTIWLHWYGSSKTLVDQGKWLIYLVPDKICKINLLILVLYHWHVTFWLSNTVLKYLHIFCYVLLFVFLPCWLVGFWIFRWRKTDKNITMALLT
jgi:hypothetical protein